MYSGKVKTYGVIFLVFLMPLVAFGKQPIGFKHWRLDDTTFVKNIGGTVRNYQKVDKAWAEIVNGFQLEGDSVFVADSAVLRTRVNRNGTSKVMLTWGENEYTIEQRLLGIGWLNVVTRQHRWIDSTMNWGNFSVDSNVCKWAGVSPGVDYGVRKGNGRVEHGTFYKPAFLDSAVILYNQRSDSLDIALANVMVYTLSANIDNADSAIGDVPWRRLKNFDGYYSFNLRDQRLRFPGCDTLPKIPVRQYWERRGTKIICIEYVMMSKVKRVHEAYPNAVVWHNDSKTIEGTTNVEDTRMYSTSAPYAYGGETTIRSTGTSNALIRVKNVDIELGVGATISACVCSLYTSIVSPAGEISAYSVFKPWKEGNQDNANCVDPGCSWEDWSCDTYEWTTGGCGSADDGGNDNSGDATGADRKATAEDTENVTTVSTWYAWNMSVGLAQGWYARTKNEEGILLKRVSTAAIQFVSTEGASNQPFWVFTYTVADLDTTIFSGTASCEDTYLNANAPTTNYGAADTLKAATNSFTWTANRVTLMRPNILYGDSISTSATAVTCSLKFWVTFAVGSNRTEFNALCKLWGEGTATYYTWDGTKAWGDSGAYNQSGTDCDACYNSGDDTGDDWEEEQDSISVTQDAWFTVEIDTCHVNRWLHGDDSLCGIRVQPINLKDITIASSEHDSAWSFIVISLAEEEEEVGTYRHSPEGVGDRSGGTVRHKP